MGFPVGYTELLLPKIFLHILSLLGLIRKFISSIFRIIGLPDFLEPDESSWPDAPLPSYYASAVNATSDLGIPTAAAALAREILPIVKFSELSGSAAECCAVCLYEFEGDDEIRQLTNCRHIFHRSCVDRWMIGYHQMTCPLCRTPLIPDALQEAFNQMAWSDWPDSGIPELFAESS